MTFISQFPLGKEQPRPGPRHGGGYEEGWQIQTQEYPRPEHGCSGPLPSVAQCATWCVGLLTTCGLSHRDGFIDIQRTRPMNRIWLYHHI